MRKTEIIRAWDAILAGRKPSSSIEVTKECPLRCSGSYAYADGLLRGGGTLHTLSDCKDQALAVRYRELEKLVPLLIERDIRVQVVTSAFRSAVGQTWPAQRTAVAPKRLASRTSS